MLIDDAESEMNLVGVVTNRLPWMKSLPDDDQREFLKDLMKAVEAFSEKDDSTELRNCLDAWRNTAEIWADPELVAELQEESHSDEYVVDIDELVPIPE